jgi:hypothetical protein
LCNRVLDVNKFKRAVSSASGDPTARSPDELNLISTNILRVTLLLLCGDGKDRDISTWSDDGMQGLLVHPGNNPPALAVVLNVKVGEGTDGLATNVSWAVKGVYTADGDEGGQALGIQKLTVCNISLILKS